MRKTKRFELDPHETARENLWRAATVAAGVVLSRKVLRLTGDEWRELHRLIVEKGVDHFMKHKIGLHKYNREQPFYNNVYSSCWSVSHNVTTKFLRELKRKISGVSLDSPSYITGFDLESKLEDTGKHPLDFSESIDDRAILEAKLEHARKMLRATHNKSFYGESLARLEAALKLDEEMTKEELKASLGLEKL